MLLLWILHDYGDTDAKEITLADLLQRCALGDCPPSSSHVHRNLQTRHVQETSTSCGAAVYTPPSKPWKNSSSAPSYEFASFPFPLAPSSQLEL